MFLCVCLSVFVGGRRGKERKKVSSSFWGRAGSGRERHVLLPIRDVFLSEKKMPSRNEKERPTLPCPGTLLELHLKMKILQAQDSVHVVRSKPA